MYTYPYEEMKITVEGGFKISDETEKEVTTNPGDVCWMVAGDTFVEGGSGDLGV